MRVATPFLFSSLDEYYALRMGTVRWASAAAFTADIVFVAGGYGHGEEACAATSVCSGSHLLGRKLARTPKVLSGVECLALGSQE